MYVSSLKRIKDFLRCKESSLERSSGSNGFRPFRIQQELTGTSSWLPPLSIISWTNSSDWSRATHLWTRTTPVLPRSKTISTLGIPPMPTASAYSKTSASRMLSTALLPFMTFRKISTHFLMKLVSCNTWKSRQRTFLDIQSCVILRQFITQALRDDRNRVLVYCAKGVNRSAAICVGFLMWHDALPVVEAVRLVAEARGRILTNPSYRKQLLDFASLCSNEVKHWSSLNCHAFIIRLSYHYHCWCPCRIKELVGF